MRTELGYITIEAKDPFCQNKSWYLCLDTADVLTTTHEAFPLVERQNSSNIYPYFYSSQHHKGDEEYC